MSRNRLASEKSPYLLQHKDNPVHWYTWGEEAFAAARREKKPIFLSIGYATCHWCHVMEHESFEQADVAAALNSSFISIKIDREERPDVDQIYMEAVVGLTGSGGWPLTVFLTPDLKPFFGGTYFPKPQFMHLLEVLRTTWQQDAQKILSAGEQIAESLRASGEDSVAAPLDESNLRGAFEALRRSYDPENGSFGGAPKFPRSMSLSLLMRLKPRIGGNEAAAMCAHTLRRMAEGGIYDHLGGGFARYATDEKWLVPHFEKMLYDNALLAVTYLEAHQSTGEAFYADVARDILDYVIRDMMAPHGGFYSAEDADSEGVEGKFYVWSATELRNTLSASEYSAFSPLFGITDEGNFEHGNNILHIARGRTWEEKRQPLVQSAMQKLFEVRRQRVHPLKDDKQLAAWNGLMIAAMAKGHRVLEFGAVEGGQNNKRYLTAAQQAADFVQSQLYKEGRLLRRYRDGESRYEADAGDYASMIHGLLTLYQTDFDPRWWNWAVDLQKRFDADFWDDKQAGYFFASAAADGLINRKKDREDGALPSSNSLAALNLLQFFGLSGELAYRDRADKLFAASPALLRQYPSAFCQLLMALDYRLSATKEVALIGARDNPQVRELLASTFKRFAPNQVVACGDETTKSPTGAPLLSGKSTGGKPFALYLCSNQSCRPPLFDLGKAQLQIME